MKSIPVPCWLRARSLTLGVVAALSAASLAAQSTTPITVPEEKPITLPTFTVSSTAASEYAATESTTGTRVAAKIFEQPFVVNTVTSQFMEEFSLLEFAEQFAYTSNFVASENLWGGYNLRGFQASVQLRNGFRRNGLSDRVNIERAEVIKGPTAAIYGITTPAGAINFVTRKPQTKPKQRLSFSGGTHNFRRGELSSTGPVGGSDKLFYRLDGTHWVREPDPIHKRIELNTLSGVLLFKPSDSTNVTLEYEYLERQEHGVSGAVMPSSQVPNVQDPYRTTGGRYTANVALATHLRDYNFQGPENSSDRDIHNVIATLEHRFNDTFSLRSSANWWERTTERNEIASRNVFRADLSPTTGGSIARGRPAFREITEGTGGWQTDLLSTFTTGEVKHKLLVTLDYARHTQTKSRQFGMINNNAVLTAGTGIAASATPINNPELETWVRYGEDPSLYQKILDTDLYIDVVGLFISERAHFMDDRLIALVSGRYDWVRNELTNNISNKTTKQIERKFTYQAGLNYAARPWLRFYANASTSFFPQINAGNAVGTSPVDGSAFALPNEEGHGIDAGIKVSTLGGNLSFTAGWFDITREKLADRVAEDIGTVTYVTGKQKSQGMEIDFNWLATPSLQFFGGYGYVDAEYGHHPLGWLVGGPLRNAPRHMASLGSRYEFKSGILKGVYVTAGFRYNSGNPTNPAGSNRTITAANVAAANAAGTPFLNNPFPNGLLPRPDLAAGAPITSGVLNLPSGVENYRSPSYQAVDAGIGYKWRTGDRRTTHRIQINGKNILDEKYFLGSGYVADGVSVTATYDVSF